MSMNVHNLYISHVFIHMAMGECGWLQQIPSCFVMSLYVYSMSRNVFFCYQTYMIHILSSCTKVVRVFLFLTFFFFWGGGIIFYNR